MSIIFFPSLLAPKTRTRFLIRFDINSHFQDKDILALIFFYLDASRLGFINTSSTKHHILYALFFRINFTINDNRVDICFFFFFLHPLSICCFVGFVANYNCFRRGKILIKV